MNKRIFSLIFIILVLFGLGTNLYYAYRISGHIDGDPATIGLMSQDVLEGRFNQFFYGQKYNGALECYWLAPFVYFFGHSPMVLFSGMTCLYLVFLFTIYTLGYLIENKYAALWAFGYSAVSPYVLIHNSVIPYGYHLALLVFGNITLILALLIDKKEDNILLWILLGFAGGLGFWNHFSIIYYLAPVAVFLCFKRSIIRNFKYYLVSLVCFFVGSLPFWIYNLQNKFSSFIIRDGKPYKYYPINISFKELINRFFTYHVSGILGVLRFNLPGILLLVVIIVSGLVFMIKMNRKRFLFVLFMLSIVFFSLSQKFFVMSPKYCYFIPIYTLVPIWIGCFVDLLNKRIRFTGVFVFIFVILFNLSDYTVSTSEGVYGKGDIESFNQKTVQYTDIMNFLRANRIDGFIGDFYTAQAVNFITNKEIAGFDIKDQRPPIDELLSAKDNFAILKYHDLFEPSLDATCKSYKKDRIGIYGVYYGFQPFEYFGEDIVPSDWTAVSNCNEERVSLAFDRDIDTYWSSENNKNEDVYYQLDLGGICKIYKLVTVNVFPDLNNYPANYTIEVSADGDTWQTILEGHKPVSLFWSGPRIYWDYYDGRWEVYFQPQEVKLIRIRQTDCGASDWMINEIFVHKYSGEDRMNLNEHLASADEVYAVLKDNNVDFVYADFWLSAKIRLWSYGRIRALSVKNDCYPERGDTNRQINLTENTAIVVERTEEEGLDAVLGYFDLPLDKEYVNEYVIYQFDNLTDWQKYFLKNQECLYWLGFTAVRANHRFYSNLLTGYGLMLENNKKMDEAIKYYKKALEIDDCNSIAGEKLNKLYSPEVRKEIHFFNGVNFLGYNLHKENHKLKMDFFWKVRAKIDEGLVVFVHFKKDGKTVFQGDHKFLEGYKKPWTYLKDWVFVEHILINIPENAESGAYIIEIGLYLPDRQGKRIKIKEPGGKSVNRIKIGEIEL